MNQRSEELAEQYFEGNGASYDHIATVSTLGLDGWWKRKILNKIPGTPHRILEQASGTGILTCKLAERFPGCRIIGVELHEGYLSIARNKVRDLKLANVEFIHGRAENVVLDGEFDCIVSDYLAKYVDLDLLVANASKMLRRDGMFIAHELTRPTNPLFVALWNLHFKALRAYGRLRHPEWNMAFEDVPSLLARTRWVEELTQSLRANGFSDITVEPQIFRASVLVTARK